MPRTAVYCTWHPADFDPVGDPIPAPSIEEIDASVLVDPQTDFICTCRRCTFGPCCGKSPDECLSTSRYVEIMTEQPMLSVMMRMKIINPGKGLNLDDPSPKNYRFTFYRGVFFLITGNNWQQEIRKFEGKRVQLPGCCVSLIRLKYPEVTGVYRNFDQKPVEEDENNYDEEDENNYDEANTDSDQGSNDDDTFNNVDAI